MANPLLRKITRTSALVIGMLLASLAMAAPAKSQETTARWTSLGADRVNLRVGPGIRYPIDWVFTAKALPVRILRSHDNWREVETSDGTKGWIHRSLLSDKRTVLVQKEMLLLQSTEADADPRARVMPGAVLRLGECEPEWCKVRAGHIQGYLPVAALWGVNGS